jgi:hypothetical protein
MKFDYHFTSVGQLDDGDVIIIRFEPIQAWDRWSVGRPKHGASGLVMSEVGYFSRDPHGVYALPDDLQGISSL